MADIHEETKTASCGCTVRIRTATYPATGAVVIEAVTIVAHCNNPSDGWY